MIPAVNDMELERILDAAAAQGVKTPAWSCCGSGEVRDCSASGCCGTIPDRVRHVLSLVRGTRDGKDYNSTWGKRMTGEGPYAVLMQQRLEKASERLGSTEQDGAPDRSFRGAAGPTSR